VTPSNTADLRDWLRRERGLDLPDYEALRRWSVEQVAEFWQALWDRFGLRSPTPHRAVLSGGPMPGAHWFEGAQLNYAAQVARHATATAPALVFRNERLQREGRSIEIAWPDLVDQAAALAATLQGLGVQRGDRVAAYLPNVPQAAVAFLACASLGAIWSLTAPDMGVGTVRDRFLQIDPVVLIACDGSVYGGKVNDRRATVAELLQQLPTVRTLIQVPVLADAGAPGGPFPFDTGAWPGRVLAWAEALATAERVAPEPVPFEHPLWIVYSSGTTGLPKPIVHGHGGVMLEGLKAALHNDVWPSVETGERFHWFSSTGWIMWNGQVSGLLGGTTICLFDGNPGGPAKAPDWGTLWRFAAAAGVTWFGAGAAFYASCLKAGVVPRQQGDLSRLHAVGSTGSPLSDDCYDWIWAQLPAADGERIWLNPISGGTDFAGAFVAGNRALPVIKGEMQCRCLGAAVAAYSDDGRELIDEVGELVCTQPMPSMPLFFWGDEGGRRYHDSYFDMFPSVWRHGDWIRITARGGAIIYGRSDATINRHGIRMGTAELYRAVEALPEVLDSLVVDLEYLGRESWMPLFVVLREGLVLDAALEQRLRGAIKAALSARHVPNEIFQVPAVPRTLSGKKMELPVKKLLMGASPAQVMNRDAMANAACVDWFVALAKARAAG
jgi:acetoacetyl-CoA synthetase